MKRSKSLYALIALLSVLLVVLCFVAAFGAGFLTIPPKAGTVEHTIWRYAKEHGYSLQDYPDSLIDLMKRNPETEEFVLSYPEVKNNTYIPDMTAYLYSDTVPLFLQWDRRWGYLNYGSDVAGLTGCGPVCLSMAAIYVTNEFSRNK